MKFGERIAVTGVRPIWLKRDEPFQFQQDGQWLPSLLGALQWTGIKEIRLPIDHPYYMATREGYTFWSGGADMPIDWDIETAVLLRSGRVYPGNTTLAWFWCETPAASDIIGYQRIGTSLHIAPSPDRFENESPIRAFTDWQVSGNYALGKGFRPSIAHIVTYLDAMETREKWQLVQILEAGTSARSFLFRKVI